MGQGAKRVDGAVDPGSLGIGETVEVRTRMGLLVTRGDVCAMTPFGVTLREDGVQHRFFAADFFLFFPESQELPLVAANIVTDGHPDDRVRSRLGAVSEGDEQVDGASDDPDGDAGSPTPSGGTQTGSAGSSGVAADTNAVDVDKLPDDIRRAVVVVSGLNNDQINYVLAQTGQTIMAALRRSGVSEAELHGMVQKSQNAIYRILSGKPAREWRKASGE